MRVLLFILVIAIAAPLAACAWDDDTVRLEEQNPDNVLEIVAGNFTRYPALYYELRLKRSEARLQTFASEWETYDNAAVAADRLGNHDKAIEIMLAKIRAMDELGNILQFYSQESHTYRANANLGTFYAHRWFANGKDFSNLDDIEKAKERINLALEENSDAHFGREKYQLRILEWLAKDPSKIVPEFDESGDPKTVYPDFLEMFRDDKIRKEDELNDAMEGLMGLIKLGAAWESLDVLTAMKFIARRQDDALTASFIGARIGELRAQGKDFLLGSRVTKEDVENGAKASTRWLLDIKARSGQGWGTPEEYWPAREKADKKHLKLVAYMTPRLLAGEHPDTDDDFRRDIQDIASGAFEDDSEDPIFDAFVDAAWNSWTFAYWFWGSVTVLLTIGGIGGSLFGRWHLRKKLAV